MTEKFYAFIKDNHVFNVAVFAEQNEELADSIAHERGFDDAVWCGESSPAMYSEYKDGKFLLQLSIIKGSVNTIYK